MSHTGRLVQLPGQHIGFVLDDGQVKYGYAIGFDGVLREIDLLAGTIRREVKVTEPYPTEGDHSVVRPALAVAGGEIVVSDPAAKALRIVDAEGFILSRTIKTEGMPYSMAVAGGHLSDH